MKPSLTISVIFSLLLFSIKILAALPPLTNAELEEGASHIIIGTIERRDQTREYKGSLEMLVTDTIVVNIMAVKKDNDNFFFDVEDTNGNTNIYPEALAIHSSYLTDLFGILIRALRFFCVARRVIGFGYI